MRKIEKMFIGLDSHQVYGFYEDSEILCIKTEKDYGITNIMMYVKLEDCNPEKLIKKSIFCFKEGEEIFYFPLQYINSIKFKKEVYHFFQ